MKIRFFKSIATIFLLIFSSTVSICLEKNYIDDEQILINNTNNKDINIKVKEI